MIALAEECEPWGVLAREHTYYNPTERIFSALEKIAIDNEGVQGRFKLAAAITYKKQILTVGINSMKSHPLQTEYGKNVDSIYLHAEIDAIRKALKIMPEEYLLKCDMYILRIKKDYDHNWIRGLARPCCGCMKAIKDYGIKRVYYTKDYEWV